MDLQWLHGTPTMCNPSAVGINDNFTASEPGIYLRVPMMNFLDGLMCRCVESSKSVMADLPF